MAENKLSDIRLFIYPPKHFLSHLCYVVTKTFDSPFLRDLESVVILLSTRTFLIRPCFLVSH